MRLNVEEWKEFKIYRDETQSGLFEIESCKCGNAGSLEDGDEINYIGAKKRDNGVMRRVMRENNLVTRGNGIIFICDGQGSVGYTNYIEEDFIGSTTISIGYDDNVNFLNGMFIVTLLDEQKFRFSYGRKYRPSFKETILKLPIVYTTDRNGNKTPKIDPTHKYSEEGYIPDFECMENYIKSLHHKPLTTKVKADSERMSLDVGSWKEFRVGDVFENRKITKHSKIPDSEGCLPFISSTVENNGIASYCDEETITGNCITVTTNGNCFKSFYHESNIVVSSDVEVLYSEKLNKVNALFLVSILDKESFKWNYGRKPKNNKVFETVIKLPIVKDKSGQPILDSNYKYSKEGYIPDFEFMEEYINGLPYGDRV